MAYVTISLEPEEPHIYRLQPIMDFCREQGIETTYCEIIMACIDLAQHAGYEEVAAIIRNRQETESTLCRPHEDLEDLLKGPTIDF
jgi:hypothetical protein